MASTAECSVSTPGLTIAPYVPTSVAVLPALTRTETTRRRGYAVAPFSTCPSRRVNVNRSTVSVYRPGRRCRSINCGELSRRRTPGPDSDATGCSPTGNPTTRTLNAPAPPVVAALAGQAPSVSITPSTAGTAEAQLHRLVGLCAPLRMLRLSIVAPLTRSELPSLPRPRGLRQCADSI